MNIDLSKPLTQRWTPLRPHPEQMRMVRSKARVQVNPAGRRSGKTERAKRRTILAAMDARTFNFPDPHFALGAPTYNQAKRIWWKDIKALSPPWAILGKPSETDLQINYITGASISIFGMDKPERIEGAPLDGIVLDEYGNMRENAWPENVFPALSDRKGWALLIGVPEGRNHYYDRWIEAKGEFNVENGGKWDGFTWHSSDILDPDEIAYAKKVLDELTYAQEYEASFINFVGQAYYPFLEERHCAKLRDKYNPKANLIFAFDFNVDPGIAVIMQEIELPRKAAPVMGVKPAGSNVTLFKGEVLDPKIDGTGIIGEVWIPRNSNTRAVCRKLIHDWGNHQGRISVYGDATGGARGTAQTEGSDWDLVREELYGHFGAERVFMKVPDGNPTERSRVNSVNSRLYAKDETIRMMVDPSVAPETRKDFEGVRLLEGGSGEIDKKHDPKRTHLTDAVGYYVVKEYPTRRETMTISELRI